MHLRIILFLVCFLVNLPSLTYAKLNLGAYTFADAPAKAIEIKTPLANGLQSLHFVNQVGGIAFDGIAKGSSNNVFLSATLDYDSNRRDGERLQIVFKDKNKVAHTVTAQIYDWQLFPIAKFANTDASACATSQGNLIDPQIQQKHMQRGDWILNYHSAFENTLLGLRLVQADFLAVIPEACDLPKFDGEYLRGNGENSPNIKSNKQKWDTFQNITRRLQEEYTAYIICDYESPVTFSIANKKLILTGEPIWCYVNCNKAVMDSIESILRQEVKARKQELYKKETGSSTITGTDYRTNARICQALLQEFTEAYIENRRAELIDSFPLSKRLHILYLYSSKMTAVIRKYREMNPEVFNALTTTMRYAAFFRWVKQVSPSSLKTLIDSHSYEDPIQNLKTPSILMVTE